MKKYIYLLLIGLFFTNLIFSQGFYSHVTQTNRTYQELENSEVILFHPWNSSGKKTIDPNISSFFGFNSTFSFFRIDANGTIGISDASSKVFVLSGLYAKLISLDATSNISWHSEGQSPERIIKVQWKNAGFETDENSFINFQIWYHENDGTIEIHFGPNSVSSMAYGQFSGPTIGLSEITSSGSVLKGYHLYGDMNDPQADESPEFISASETPANGSVYTFNNLLKNVSVKGYADLISFNCYPNPINDDLNFSQIVSEAYIYSISGQELLSVSNTNSLNLRALQEGIYLLRVQIPGGESFIKKIVKQ